MKGVKEDPWPKNLWQMLDWAKRLGVVVKVETNTSAHGGADISFTRRSDGYALWHCVEKTFMVTSQLDEVRLIERLSRRLLTELQLAPSPPMDGAK